MRRVAEKNDHPYLDSAKISTRKVQVILRNGLTKEHQMARIDVERLHRISGLQEEDVLAGEADEDKIAHSKPMLHARTTLPMTMTRVRNLHSYRAVHITSLPP